MVTASLLDDKVRIFEVAAKGEQSRGSNGALVVDEYVNTVVYLLVNEIQDQYMREKVSEQQQLTEDGSEFIIILHRITEEEYAIVKVDRLTVFNETN